MDKFLAYYDDENDVLYIKIGDILGVEDLNDLIAQSQKMLQGKTHRHVLVDMSESSQFDASAMTKEMRSYYKELLTAMNADKTVIFGANPALRMVAKIALAVSGKSAGTHFSMTKEEGLAWLKGKA